MSDTKTILVIGTYDTKDDELGFSSGVIRDQGGQRRDHGCVRPGRSITAHGLFKA